MQTLLNKKVYLNSFEVFAIFILLKKLWATWKQKHFVPNLWNYNKSNLAEFP